MFLNTNQSFFQLSEFSDWRRFCPNADLVLFIIPTFEENAIFMLGVAFLIQSIFAVRNNSF